MRSISTSLRLLGRTLGLLWSTSRLHTVLLLLGAITNGLVPVGRLWVAKLIIDRLVADVASGRTDVGPLVSLVVIEFLLTALGTALGTVGETTTAALSHLLRVRVGEAIMRVAMRLDFAALENPSFHDRLHRAQMEAGYRPLNLLMQVSYAASGLVGLVGTLALLVSVNLLAPIVLVALALPYLYVQIRGGQAAFYAFLFQSADARRLDYLGQMTSQPDVAKEVRLFSLADYLLGAYNDVGQRMLRKILGIVRFVLLGGALTSIAAMAGYAAAYLYFIAQTLSGRMTIGDLTVYTGAFLQGSQQAEAIARGLGAVLENGLFLRDLFEFLDMDRDTEESVPLQSQVVARSTSGELTLESVYFRYPGQSLDAIEGVTLRIPAGQVVALVGENGAGKTTLIKLICGLYHARAGRILYNGQDIAELEPDQLRAHFGVLFQDFVHYHLTARENIGFGDTTRIHDERRIRAAAERAGIDAALKALPDGYETILSRAFDGGHELSSGEWQRLALARAYMRDARILILDEPTANLDARAEQRVFEEVRRLLVGRTVIVISHRFSSVRLANHILVMHEGRLVEQGSHDQLMSLGGRYAELYAIQAAAYR